MISVKAEIAKGTNVIVRKISLPAEINHNHVDDVCGILFKKKGISQDNLLSISVYAGTKCLYHYCPYDV